MMNEYSHERYAFSIAMPEVAKSKKHLRRTLFKNYIFFFSVICFCVSFVCGAVSAEVYKDNWRWYPTSEKIEYVRGLYEGTMFTLRSVYVFDPAKKETKYAQLLPVMTDIRAVVQMIDDFYKAEDTEKISVSWALYIIAQKQLSMPPDRVQELQKNAICDYHAVRS